MYLWRFHVTFLDMAIFYGQRRGNVYYIEKRELIDTGFRKEGQRLEDASDTLSSMVSVQDTVGYLRCLSY